MARYATCSYPDCDARAVYRFNEVTGAAYAQQYGCAMHARLLRDSKYPAPDFMSRLHDIRGVSSPDTAPYAEPSHAFTFECYSSESECAIGIDGLDVIYVAPVSATLGNFEDDNAERRARLFTEFGDTVYRAIADAVAALNEEES